jgi:hypothetical protein
MIAFSSFIDLRDELGRLIHRKFHNSPITQNTVTEPNIGLDCETFSAHGASKSCYQDLREETPNRCPK